MRNFFLTLLVAVFTLMITACGGGASSNAQSPVGGESQSLTWRDIMLRNVQTGETFTLADFAGRTVYVHPMARW
jgi:hypothetical protein